MSGHKALKISLAVLGAMAFLFSANLRALTVKVASIDGVKGTVTITDQEGKSRAAVNGATVLGEEIVDTGKDGSVALLFEDGSKIELGHSTRAKVNDMMITGNTTVLLYLGRLFAHIIPAQGVNNYEFQTVTTTAGVRGTEFEMAVGLDGSSLVSVESGQVEIGLESSPVSVKSGEEADISYDGKVVKSSRGARTDEEWQKWFSARQQYFIDHPGQGLERLSQNLDRTRNRICDQDEKMTKMNKRLARAYERGNLSYDQARKIAKMEIDSYMKLMVELAQTDNKMMAVDYIITQVQEQIKLNPDNFSPEFKDKLGTVRAICDQMNVQETHQKDRQILAKHMAAILKAAKKFNLMDEVWKNLPPKTRKMIIQRAMQQK
jgi:hypothetical protein